MEITFDQLPSAVGQLLAKMDNLERIILGSKPTSPQADELLTVHQAADFLNLAPQTVYSMVSRKELPFSKKSKRLYFSKQELTDWIKSGRKQTISEIQAEAVKNVGTRKGRV